MTDIKANFDGLTEEQMAKARACKTPAELAALAKEEGVELTDEQLESVSGGLWGECKHCTAVDCPHDSRTNS